MKTINNLLFISVAVIFLIATSCEDYLDLKPTSSYNAAGFYSTQKDFELAINGDYAMLRSIWGYKQNFLESRGDEVQDDPITTADHVLAHRFLNDASTPLLKDLWSYYWKIIDRSNAIIDKIDNGTFTDETYRSYRKGEAYFLRGYAYWQLGNMFGGVQIINHQMSISEIMAIPRSTEEETLNQAISDLLTAADLLPEVWPKTSELGRATKFSAEGIAAKVYLYQHKFQDAKPLLENIINSGKYTMATNYADCFLDRYDNSPEHVFQVQFISGDVGLGFAYPVCSITTNVDEPTLYPYGGISGANRVSPDLIAAYEPGDKRLDFTIMQGYHIIGGGFDANSNWCIKYVQGTKPSTGNKYDYPNNLPILRYTDVKLMYAEVLNEEGYVADGEAFTILNEVRQRAGLPNLTSATLTSQSEFRSAIFHERRVEFAFEHQRWIDLKRSGNVVNVMNAFFARTDEGGGNKYHMEDFHKLYPIPQEEILLNPNLTQNPGY